ncbi:MAG: peptide chain release factor N(5)-glutamine methyltransferase [Candidatus Caccovivens sp.]
MKNTLFPLSNGVQVCLQDKQVISLIDCNGQKKLKSSKNENKIIFWHFPFMRGIQYFFCGIFGFFQALVLANDLCGSTIRIKDLKKYYTQKLIVLGLIAIFAILFSAFALGYVPAKLGYLMVGAQGSTLLRNFCIMTLKLAFFYIFLLFFRIFPAVNECFRFNRAISKSKTDQTPNFLNYFIFVFVLHFVVIHLIGASFGFWFNILLNIAIFLVCTSVAYEVAMVVQKFKFLHFLSFVTGCLCYAKPTRTHFETVSVALTEMNMLVKGREFMEDESKKAFSVVYNEVKNKLALAGINEKSEADWLIATVLGKNRAEIKLVPFVTDKQYEEIVKATDRRAKGESLDNIFGYTEFYGLRFDVNKKVLTPRMETELLVELVLKAQQQYKHCTILDLGTGSGAIAVSVAKNCDARVTAIDVSKSALLVAESNAKKNGVEIEFLHSNLFTHLKRKRKFDIIVSNPPYIPTKDIAKLDKNVRECDPTLALDGGEDGLDFYRQIASELPSRLNAGGQVFFEIGKGQARAVRKILRDAGLGDIKTMKDYNKIERFVCGRYK